MKFLIVDDSQSNRFLLNQMLKIMGHDAKSAVDGSVAINMMKEEKFDVVFMDIEMPVMNGLETTRYIREQMFLSKERLPVIAITAHYPEEMMHQYQNIGFNGFLSKPITMERIKNVLENL